MMKELIQSMSGPPRRKFSRDTRKEILELEADFQKAQRKDIPDIRFMNISVLEPALSYEEYSSQLRDVIDDFAEYNGLKRIGDSWCEVSEKTARWTIEKLLSHDLAYHSELFEHTKVGWISQEFIWRTAMGNTIASSGKGCRYFINGEQGGPSLYHLDTKKEILGWQPVTDHTIDLAIVMITSSRIGIIWGWGED